MKRILIIILFCVSGGVAAQQKMNLEQLVERLWQVNYSLEIAGARVEQASNEITLEQFLPTVRGTVRQSQTGTYVPENNNLSAGLSAGWRLFDGLAMFNSYDRQKKMYSISELNRRESLENTTANVTAQYYLIISLKNRVAVAEESMRVSQLRYREALEKYTIGAMSGLEMKLARTDLNTDSSTLIRSRESLDLAYIELNGALQFTSTEKGYVDDTIILGETLAYDMLEKVMMNQNTQLLLAKAGAEVSDIDLRLQRAARYPTLDFEAGYNWSATDAGQPYNVLRMAPGFNWGFNLGVNIFSGQATTRKIKNAQIEQNIAQLTVQNTRQSLLTSLRGQYTTYSNNLRQISFEVQNADAMRLNLEVALERYRLGDLSGIDLRIIQQQYLQSVDRKINVIYQAKLSEIELLTLSSTII